MLAGLPDADAFGDEIEWMGRVILAAGAIETTILSMLATALGGDSATAIRLLYRLNTTSQKMNVVDAICRPISIDNDFLDHFKDATDDARFCASLRNQYAHGTFQTYEGALYFSNLDEWAKKRGATKSYRFYEIDLETIKSQYDFIVKSKEYIAYVISLFPKVGQTDLRDQWKGVVPKRAKRPKKHTREGRHSRQMQGTYRQAP